MRGSQRSGVSLARHQKGTASGSRTAPAAKQTNDSHKLLSCDRSRPAPLGAAVFFFSQGCHRLARPASTLWRGQGSAGRGGGGGRRNTVLQLRGIQQRGVSGVGEGQDASQGLRGANGSPNPPASRAVRQLLSAPSDRKQPRRSVGGGEVGAFSGAKKRASAWLASSGSPYAFGLNPGGWKRRWVSFLFFPPCGFARPPPLYFPPPAPFPSLPPQSLTTKSKGKREAGEGGRGVSAKAGANGRLPLRRLLEVST